MIDEIETTWQADDTKKSLENCIKHLKAAQKAFNDAIAEVQRIDEAAEELDWEGLYYDFERNINTAGRYINDAVRSAQELQSNDYGENIYTYLTVEYPDDYESDYTHEDYEAEIISKLGLRKIKQETK